MKRRLIAIALTVVLLAAAVVPAAASQEKAANALNHLQLFLGMGNGDYALEQKLTRAQGITLLVRMIGKESEAQAGTYSTPFKDIPQWAVGYIGYAYTMGITNGTGDDTFSPDAELSDNMFLTLVLRALGYTDSGETPMFVWDDPYALACTAGLIEQATADAAFTRGDAVAVFWETMYANLYGKEITLAEQLIAQGVFSAEAFAAAEALLQDAPKQPQPPSGGGTVVIPSVPSGGATEEPTLPDDGATEDSTIPNDTAPAPGVGGLPIVP